MVTLYGKTYTNTYPLNRWNSLSSICYLLLEAKRRSSLLFVFIFILFYQERLGYLFKYNNQILKNWYQ